MSRLYPLSCFTLILVINVGFPYELCNKFYDVIIPRKGMFQIPKVNPAFLITEDSNQVSLDLNIASIDEVMCFSKLNLSEKNCLSIYLIKVNEDESNLNFFGHSHKLISESQSTTEEVNNPFDFNKTYYPLFSVCKVGLGTTQPNYIAIGSITSNNNDLAHILGELVGDVEYYNANFNAKTQDLGLTQKTHMTPTMYLIRALAGYKHQENSSSF